jgi:hypothetical protein
MKTHRTVGAVTAAFLVSLACTLGCAGSDLTLPGSDGSGGSGGAGPDRPGMPLPAVLVAADGDGQTAAPGAVLADPLVVQVLDSAGVPVPGTLITFSFQGNPAGAALDPTAILTGTDGRAAATVRLGAQPGEQIIVAAIASSRLPDLQTSFSVTAIPTDTHGHGGRDGHHGDND